MESAKPFPTTHVRDHEEPVLKVGKDSDVKALASSLSFALTDNKTVCMRAIGAAAVNQMAKAACIARGYVASRGVDLVVRPGFIVVPMPNQADPSLPDVDTTAVVFFCTLG